MNYERNDEQPQNGKSRDDGPIDTLRDGALKASIWRNEGENGPFFTTKLGKTYEDRNGKLKDSQSFSNGDLIKLSELTRRAYVRTSELYREVRNEREQEGDGEPYRDKNRTQRDYREKRQSRNGRGRATHDRQ